MKEIIANRAFKRVVIPQIIEQIINMGQEPNLVTVYHEECGVPLSIVNNGVFILNISSRNVINFKYLDDGITFGCGFNRVPHTVFIPYELLAAVVGKEGIGVEFTAIRYPENQELYKSTIKKPSLKLV